MWIIQTDKNSFSVSVFLFPFREKEQITFLKWNGTVTKDRRSSQPQMFSCENEVKQIQLFIRDNRNVYIYTLYITADVCIALERECASFFCQIVVKTVRGKKAGGVTNNEYAAASCVPAHTSFNDRCRQTCLKQERDVFLRRTALIWRNASLHVTREQENQALKSAPLSRHVQTPCDGHVIRWFVSFQAVLVKSREQVADELSRLQRDNESLQGKHRLHFELQQQEDFQMPDAPQVREAHIAPGMSELASQGRQKLRYFNMSN